MGIKIETISAITLKVVCMETAVEFYRDVLGMKILYGGPGAAFSSLQMHGKEYPILNLERNKLGANDFSSRGCRFILASFQGEGVRTGATSGCELGRALLPHARS